MMISKKKLLIYFIILLCFIRIIISYSYIFYNKKYKINFSINGFEENSFEIDRTSIYFYEATFNREEYENPKTLIFLHDIFKSSHDSLHLIKENKLDEYNNIRVILIDLPAHGKSSKKNNLDYSYRNISYYINSLVESLNITDPYLICNNLSSNIGINMISMNDNLIKKLVMINPNFNYNSRYVILSNKIYNGATTLISFVKLLYYNDKESLDNYIRCYFNYKKSSNKYISKILEDSQQTSPCDMSSSIPIHIFINDKQYINPKSIKNLSENFSSITISP